MTVKILIGDVRDKLAELEPDSVDCVVTSPPYWGLRDYGTGQWEGGDPACQHRVGGQVQDNKAPGAITTGVRPGVDASRCKECGAVRIDQQLGLEPTWQEHVATMADVFDDVRRVLKPQGTLWLNYGDSYATSVNGRPNNAETKKLTGDDRTFRDKPFSTVGGVLKPKDLCGIPWRVAFALQERGWWLRQDIIWSKPNPMPESIRDRCTKAHEYLFLLAKSERYYFDALAIREPASDTGRENGREGRDEPPEARPPGSRPRTLARLDYTQPRKVKILGGWDRGDGGHGTIHRAGRTSAEYQDVEIPGGRNKRSVWTIATQSFPEAHFATFPPALIEPCILAGCPEGGLVLDPFFGAGTTGLVADRLGRDCIGIDLNPEYAELAQRRIEGDSPMFAQVNAA